MSHKIVLESLVDSLVASAIQELARPDADPNDPFGAYLFGDNRKDVDERDTALEQDFHAALIDHITRNDTRDLSVMIPFLRKMINTGKYTEYLLPPDDELVYRMIAIDSDREVAEITGVDPYALWKSETNIVAVQGGSYAPMKGVDSWSLDARSTMMFIGLRKKYQILLVSKVVSDGTWINNPYTMADILGSGNASSLMRKEQEVFLTAPTKLMGSIILAMPAQGKGGSVPGDKKIGQSKIYYKMEKAMVEQGWT